MANRHHILLLIAILTLLFSSQSEKKLIVESINNKKAKLIFKIDEDDFQNSAIAQPKNSAGYPLYTFILTVDRNSIIEFDYTIKKMTDINYSIQSDLFVDGISKNERHYIDNQPVFVSKELIKNDTKYILLSISPVKDNMLYTEIDVDIISEQLISPSQLEIINISDASKILSRNTELESTPVLLIIAPDGDNIYNLMMPLLNWKKQKGYKVFYYTLSEIGYTTTEIKAFIQSAYSNWQDRPNYICLIGDADGPYSVPTFNELLSTYNGEGDHPYTLLDGDDNISDIAIGRLSIRSLSDLATISNKIINYEQNPYLGATNWFKRALCVGDPSVSGMSTIITNQIIAELMISNDYNEVLEVYQYPFVNQIENGINSGVSFYNYRGFAGSSGWQKDEADDLNNGYMLPIVSVITCDTGSFLEDEESTSENFLRAGSISIPKGGIAAIGMATQGTHTMFNNCLDYGLYHGIFAENILLVLSVLSSCASPIK